MVEQFRLGKKPPKLDIRNLKLARYLPKKLVTPPPKVDHYSRLKDIGNMTNDKHGSCTIAAAGHMVQSWTEYAERGMYSIPDDDILKAYYTLSPYDQGAYILDALGLWRNTGIGIDKIEAYVEVAAASLLEAKLSVYYFGSCYIGLRLPDNWDNLDWTDTSLAPNINNGHAVCIIGYDDDEEMFKVATWGRILDMSYDFFLKYNDEAFAALNDISLIEESQVTPEGFDFVGLQNDLEDLGKGDVNVDPPPRPDPVPPAPKPKKTWIIFVIGGIIAAAVGGFALFG